MKLTVYQSEKGDCLLLTSASGANILVDGGMRQAYRQFVAPAMGTLRKQGKKLDLVYVSHIDQDHISGILELVDNLVAWRVHDFQRKQGNASFPKPKVPRPPEISGIWHNAFSAMITKNTGAIENLLAQSSRLFSLASTVGVQSLATQIGDLAQSVSEAIQLSQRISGRQLNIPLNAQFDGQLAMVRSPAAPEATIGGMKISVIGPFAEDLAVLRKDWDNWLRANAAAVKKLLAKSKADAQDLGVEAAAAQLSAVILTAAGLGDRSKVTPPNLASLMLLVEEGTKTLLLTGDGHADDILDGLEHHQRFDADDHLHVDVLKVQHHGSENNIHETFCRRVTADNYVFCGNGKHENPDLRVVDLIATMRLAESTPRPFKFWINSSAAAAPSGAPRQHMQKVETLVNKLVGKSGGRLKARFLNQPSLGFTI